MSHKHAKQVVKSYWDAAQKQVKYLKPLDEKGRLHGWVIKFYPSGRMAGRGLFKNGRVVGAPETYYDALDTWGRPLIKTKTPFINKLRNGIEKFWNEYGQLRRETTWVNGKREGIERRYGPCCVTETVYKNNQRSGIEETRHTNGRLMARVLYENDCKTGLEIINDAYGIAKERFYTPTAIYEVRPDFKHDAVTLTVYGPNFAACLKQKVYPMGRNWQKRWLLSEQSPAYLADIANRFLSTNKGSAEKPTVQKQVVRFRPGCVEAAKTIRTQDKILTYYDAEGIHIQSETPLLNNRRHGVVKYWTQDGICLKETTYRFGRRHGIEVQRDRAGHLMAERLFEKGVCRHEKKYAGSKGLWRETHFDATGRLDGEDIVYYVGQAAGVLKIKSKAVYRAGKRVGALIKYFKNGRIAAVIPMDGTGYTYDEKGRVMTRDTYQNGVLHGVQMTYDTAGRPREKRMYDKGRVMSTHAYPVPSAGTVPVQMFFPCFEREG